MTGVPGSSGAAPPVGEVVSVNVGAPRTVTWRGRDIRTGIFKRPTTGAVTVRRHNLDGDAQADPVHHGGALKAVYAYPREHYPYWRGQLGGTPPAPGAFGENLTVAGLLEDEVCVGDLISAGSALLRVTEPRYPCFKLGIRLGDDTVPDRFVHANRPGFYLAVEEEGELRAGDRARVVLPHPGRLTVGEVMRLRALSGPEDVVPLRAALGVDALTDEWRGHLEDRLDALEARRAAPAWPGARRFGVTARRSEAAGVTGLTLTPLDAGPLAGYHPGQFVAVEQPGREGSRPLVRCYSLCEPPDGRGLRIAVKRIEPARRDGGVSAWLHDRIGEGDEVLLRAPAGAFTADPRGDRPLVLIAGGIGVTPIHAIAAAVADGRLDRDAHVFLAARRAGEDPLARSLLALAAGSDRLQVRVVYSQEAAEPGGPSGRLTAELVLDTVGTTDVDVLLCGPEGMVRDLPAALRAAGVRAGRIGLEAFGPAAAQALGTAVAVPPGGLAVTFAASGRTARWEHAGDTLLDVAEAGGVDLPFSCRSGSCGSCAVAVRSGEVAYVRAPAAQVRAGECLACVAVPRTALELEA